MRRYHLDATIATAPLLQTIACMDRRKQAKCFLMQTAHRMGFRRLQAIIRPVLLQDLINKEICQLRREGWRINQKKTRRIYRELGLKLRNKTPKRRVKAKLREAALRNLGDQCPSATRKGCGFTRVMRHFEAAGLAASSSDQLEGKRLGISIQQQRICSSITSEVGWRF